ncbi:MAG: pyridoxal phosphate-dependent aminotransferase, partial [Gammaproteobacteria bacterium]|nr:pyridoxal phosphate-dependent aminotransferase [Gammaproteobacteria bacterium]
MKSYLSTRLKRIQPSLTIAISDRARQLRASGHDVISLSQGEPDFETPEHIKAAAAQAMRDGHTRYSFVDGIPELKQAVCRKFKNDNDLIYQASQISISSGCKQILFNAFMATLNAGDEVIIPAPYWVSYPAMVEVADGTPVVLRCGAEQNFKMTAAMLESAITPSTRWLVLNNPSNPTGTVYTRAELLALSEVLLKYPDVLVMVDDIYEHLVYGETEFCTLAQVAPELMERILTCNGMSKAYCMTGWRIGFAGGAETLIKAMAKLQSQSTFHPSTISQHAALAGLTGDRKFLVEHLQAYRERRDILVRQLNFIDGIDCALPDGAFYVFPSCVGL